MKILLKLLQYQQDSGNVQKISENVHSIFLFYSGEEFLIFQFSNFFIFLIEVSGRNFSIWGKKPEIQPEKNPDILYVLDRQLGKFLEFSVFFIHVEKFRNKTEKKQKKK